MNIIRGITIVLGLVIMAIAMFFMGVGMISTPSYASGPISPYVRIEAGFGVGSGVHIGNGNIITARHVVDNVESIEVKIEIAPGKTVSREAVVIWTNPFYDIAVVHISDVKFVPTVEMNCRPNYIGQRVKLYGNPLAEPFLYTNAEVISHVAKHDDWESLVTLDGTLLPGQSGGPAIDEDGKIVGIAVMTMTMGGIPIGLGGIVPASDVCRLLRTERNTYNPIPGEMALLVDQINKAIIR